ncbi:MAG: hypothetical protein K0S39_281 [Paenibacillus sp.]|jgi:hypothetical protein|nr:hypothetical protein [Paenibacillus sp.]
MGKALFDITGQPDVFSAERNDGGSRLHVRLLGGKTADEHEGDASGQDCRQDRMRQDGGITR